MHSIVRSVVVEVVVVVVVEFVVLAAIDFVGQLVAIDTHFVVVVEFVVVADSGRERKEVLRSSEVEEGPVVVVVARIGEFAVTF